MGSALLIPMFVSVYICEMERTQILYFFKQWPLSLLCNVYLLWHMAQTYTTYFSGTMGMQMLCIQVEVLAPASFYSFSKGAFLLLADTGEQGEV